jgi:hypothetical protein
LASRLNHASTRFLDFSLIFNIQGKMPSKKVDLIEIANSKSLEDFIAEYLPPRSAPLTPIRLVHRTRSRSSASRFENFS